MAAPKLDEEQREALLTWMAAEYDTRLIRKWFAAQKWPELSRAAFAYYRKRHGQDIEVLRQERRSRALNSGVALMEERVARLAAHADELEAIKWVPDEHGRLWNEKAWRETLDDIAKEMNHRRQNVELTGKNGGPIGFSWDATLAEIAHGSDAGADPPGTDAGAEYGPEMG